MNSFLKVSFFALFIIFSGAVSVTAEEELNAKPAIWLVEDDTSKVYFLGSFHLLPYDVKWYGGDLKAIVDKAEEVVFEVHMTPNRHRQAQRLTLQNGMLSEGDSLKNYLTVEEMDFLYKQARAYGIPTASIINFKPWFASVALSISAITREGWNPESGVDKFIEEIVASRGVKISALETLEEQMATLYGYPLETQAEMLRDTLDQLKEIKQVTLEMIDSWMSGNENLMIETLINPMKQQRDVYNKLLVQRNDNWIPVIEGLLEKDQNTLVVAGAAHFVGEDGVIKLLADKGYMIKRVQ